MRTWSPEDSPSARGCQPLPGEPADRHARPGAPAVTRLGRTTREAPLATGRADRPGELALGAADLADDHVLARRPGALVGIDVGLRQAAGGQLRIQVAAQPALAARQGLAA